MPKGPTGQKKRLGDVIGAAIRVAKIATGEVEDETMAWKDSHQKRGLKGGNVRTQSRTPERRREIAAIANNTRWTKTKTQNP